MRRWVLCLLLLAATSTSWATEFKVIKVDDNLAYVAVGRKDGVAPGQALEVVERVEAGGAAESFHFGWLVLDSVGDGVALAKVPDELKPHVHVGSVVRLPVSAEPTPPPTPTLALPAPAPSPAPAEEAIFRHQPERLVPPGVPLTLTIFAPAPSANPVVMYRRADRHEYAALPFSPRPDGYYTAAVPADDVQPPYLDYYIVIDDPRAPRRLAFADPEAPARVEVEGRFNASEELARYGVRDEVSAMTEYVLYRSSLGSDHYARVEAEYLHRIFQTLYSMRFGAGWLTGQAFAKGDTMASDAGFLYAYTEAEVRLESAPVAFIPRLILGVNETGVGGGFEARVRFGDELGMNFEGGVTVISELGFDTFVALAIHPTPRLALALDARIENLPLASQLGFRTYIDGRYKLSAGWAVSLRLGAAARSIETVGPDTGLGLVYGF